MEWTDLFAALGLALVLEGIAYTLFPDAMRRMMEQVLSLPSSNVRTTGLIIAIVGIGIVWLVRG